VAIGGGLYLGWLASADALDLDDDALEPI